MFAMKELPEIKFETPISKGAQLKINEFNIFTKNRRSMADLKVNELERVREEDEKQKNKLILRNSLSQRKLVNKNIITIKGKTYKRRDILELKEYFDSVMDTNNGYEFSRMFPNERGVMTFK